MGDDGRVVLDPSATERDGADELGRAASGCSCSGTGSSRGRCRSRRGSVGTAAATPCCSTDLFGGTDRAADPLGRPAGYADGVRSVAVGIAGNESLRTGQPVLVEELGL